MSKKKVNIVLDIDATLVLAEEDEIELNENCETTFAPSNLNSSPYPIVKHTCTKTSKPKPVLPITGKRASSASPRSLPPAAYKHVHLDTDQDIYFDLPELGYRVHLRPYLRQFLIALFDSASTVSIWSAGGKEYVNKVANYLECLTGRKFYTVWSAEQCKEEVFLNNKTGEYETHIIKPLGCMYTSDVGKAAGMNGQNTLLVDDLHLNWGENKQNTYCIPPYTEIGSFDAQLPNVLEKVMKWIQS
jgi:hypothetical protein